MRIIAGELKGRRFSAGEHEGLRPTSDRVREALFSALISETELEGTGVLDLYAGSGALGMEALSRGAAHATFIEGNPKLIAELKKNAATFELTSRCNFIAGQIPKVLNRRSGESAGRVYDIVFADPPYDNHPGLKLADELVKGDYVRNGSLLVIESATRSPLAEPGNDTSLSPVLLKAKVYGDTQVSFFRFESRS